MPGKPAARLTDSTAHGGLISGPGCPTVLIGKMPAACLGDMHVCPMVTPGVPPIPHVGGPITLGSTGVFIGKKPAARMGDMAVCVGPPSSVIKGEMTVMIGEAGSGSQAGSAGTAAAAAKASTKGPNSVNALEILQNEVEATEIHTVDIEFVDSAGNPLAGVPFTWTDPNSTESLGYSSPKGKWFRGGFLEAGSIEVKVKSLHSSKWGSSALKLKEAIDLECTCENFEGTELAILTISCTQPNTSNLKYLDTLHVKISGETLKESWTLSKAELFELTDPDFVPEFIFSVAAGNVVTVSPFVPLSPEESEAQEDEILAFDMSF